MAGSGGSARWWNLAGAAGDHRGRHDVGLRRRSIAVESGEERGRCLPSDRGRVLGQHGDGRIEEITHRYVVEPDEGDVVMLPRRPEAAHDADRHEVLCGEDRSRRFIERQQILVAVTLDQWIRRVGK